MRSTFGTVLNTPGVHRIVSFGGVAYPIPDAEIVALQQALSSGGEVSPVPYLAIGQKVQVAFGPLAGVTGIIARQKNRDRLVISVEIIMKSVSVDISSSDVIALDPAT